MHPCIHDMPFTLPKAINYLTNGRGVLAMWLGKALVSSVCYMTAVVIAVHTGGAAAGPAAVSPSEVRKTYVRPDEIPFPGANPYTPEKADVGKVLFFDPRLS